MEVSIIEAETNLREMVNRVLDGEEVVLTQSGERIVKLVRVAKRHRSGQAEERDARFFNGEERRRWVGADEGRGEVFESFFEPLDDETIEYLTGERE